MQSASSSKSFKKLLQICRQHNILNFCSADGYNGLLQYGPNGSLLKRNIFYEWLHSHINNDDTTLFPLEVPIPYKPNFLWKKPTNCSSGSFIEVVVKNYFETLPLIKQNLPFGFATYGPYHIDYTNAKISDEFSLKNLKSWSHSSIIFFCPPKKSMHWFHYWSKQRYLWWRKFSNLPSMFSMSEVTKNDTVAQKLLLCLECPWGKEHLESVTLYENGIVEGLFRDYCEQNLNINSVPTVIMCETGLDTAVLAYLFNSFAEKWRDGQVKNILQLHYKLASYKVCILLEGEKLEIIKKLKNVANHLLEELRNSGILVYPITEYKISIETHFNSLDEMGVPYIIVLSENTLQTGVIGLRNRDTTLQEKIHVTELTSKLVKYLKIR